MAQWELSHFRTPNSYVTHKFARALQTKQFSAITQLRAHLLVTIKQKAELNL